MAWTNALNIARNGVEREGIFIHLARVKIAALRFDEARAQLDAVTNAFYADVKTQMERNLAERENAATNPIVAMPTNQLPEISTNISVRHEVIVQRILADDHEWNRRCIRRLFSKYCSVMTNVPPIPPKPLQLQTPPPLAPDAGTAFEQCAVRINFVSRRLCGDILAHELLRTVEI